jgi:hypothetical protein
MIYKTKQPQIEQLLYQARLHLCDVTLKYNKLYDAS